MKVNGHWPGAADHMWHRGQPRHGSETAEVRRVLAEWRERNGWEPGMTWNPYTGTYEHPQTSAGRVPTRSATASRGTTARGGGSGDGRTPAVNAPRGSPRHHPRPHQERQQMDHEHQWVRDTERRREGLACAQCGVTEAELEASVPQRAREDVRQMWNAAFGRDP